MNNALERLHIGQRHIELVEGHQVLRVGVVHLHLAQRNASADADRGCGLLFKDQFQIRVEQTGLELNGDGFGDVAGKRCQIKALNVEVRIRLTAIGKRCGLGGGFKRTAIQGESQLGGDLDFAIGIEIAQERNAQIELAQLLLATDDAIVEVDRSITQHDVVQREVLWIALGLFLAFGHRGDALEDVVEVELTRSHLRHAYGRRINLDGVEDWGKTHQRLPSCIYIYAANFHLLGSTIGTGDRNVVHGQLQRPRFELDLAYFDLAAEEFRAIALGIAAQQWRNRQPGNDTEQQHGCHEPGNAAQPLVIAEKCDGRFGHA